ncbi:MAG TPA: hypothetical protein PKW95_23335 [bacterium]|nr:hypothetical protein [bacterium]
MKTVFVDKLPERIHILLNTLGVNIDDIIFARKTTIKPNSTIPTLWLIATKHYFFLCSTHRTRGLWEQIDRNNIIEIRKEMTIMGNPYLRFISKSIDKQDLIVTFSKESTVEDYDKITDLFSSSR